MRAMSQPVTGRRLWPAALAVAGSLLALPVAPAVSAGAATGPGARVETEVQAGVRLSDERKLSRWAHPARPSSIYSRPVGAARKAGRLRFFTEDGFPEVYLLLSRYIDEQEREWVQIRIPRRPAGRKGWVPRDALGPYHVVRTQMIVNRATLRVTLLERGKRIFQARVGVGKASTPTPAGRFWIREKFRFKNAPFYGTYALGTGAYAPGLTDWPNGGVVGIHGTNQPELVPGRPSHGCIRVRNEDVARLWRLTPVGTPLLIK